MRAEQRIRDWSFALMSVVAVLLIFGFSIGVASVFFQWSGFAVHFHQTLSASGAAGLVIILSLALVNFCANLNIISKLKSLEIQKDQQELKGIPFYKALSFFLVILAVITSAIWFAEYINYKNRVSDLRKSADKIVSLQGLTSDIAQNIFDKEKTSHEDLLEIFDTIYSISGDCCPAIIVALNSYKDYDKHVVINETRINNKNDDDKDKPLLELDLGIYAPRGREKDRFAQLVNNEINEFAVLSEHHNDVLLFRKIETPYGNFILKLSTDPRTSFGRITSNISQSTF